MTDSQPVDIAHLAHTLRDDNIAGVTIGWVDNNGVVRSRAVPTSELAGVARRGVGVTAVFAVFDSHDGITFAHSGLSTPSGDVRLIPVIDSESSVVSLAGQPGMAWVHGRQMAADGAPWPYDQRAVLERQVQRAADAGFEVRAGFEIEFALTRESDGLPAHRGPAYSANAMRDVDEFAVLLLESLATNGLSIGQIHAEYGGAQLEIALSPLGPMAAADAQILARQTIHTAARAVGLRASFAPLPSSSSAGNGWHLHTSLVRDGHNALTGDGEYGLSETGRSYIAGLVRELPGLVAITAPSSGSLLRRRPGYWAGAFGFWGIENREAAVRLVPSTPLLGPDHTNVELKACDASANPYLALAVTIAAGLSGVADSARLPQPVQEDVGGWDDARRDAAGISPLATTHDRQRENLLASTLVADVLGDELLGAFVACRDADAAWASSHTEDELLESLRWIY
ncbi:Glutamine synthetase, type III [Rhodococcus sp. AW25M09]|uniref:glutamine synthetase family protein n=1 Tax=Rhodococcus sp. AW25M09 TaxID=1268303 RepID=UPI0002AD06E7|nr:glutamine synthetase family protein [Rhodococcus sp. AW25M09]CCQ17296.1 Glutamine synthetase, type III [Rhodococcus sp. AW25M09]